MKNTSLATKVNEAFGSSLTDDQIDSLPRVFRFCGIRFPIFAQQIATLLGYRMASELLPADEESHAAIEKIEEILSAHYGVDPASPFNSDPPKDAPNYDWHRKGPALRVMIRK